MDRQPRKIMTSTIAHICVNVYNKLQDKIHTKNQEMQNLKSYQLYAGAREYVEITR